MVSPYTMSIIMAPLLALMVYIGYHVFVPADLRNNHKIEKRELIKNVIVYLIPISSVYFLINIQDNLVDILGINPNPLSYSHYLILLEGDMVSHFQSIVNPVLTYTSAFIYLLVFPFMLIFTFFILIYTQNQKALEEFTIAFVLIYLIAFPFYVFVPVEVTGYTLHNVQPLLYNLSPVIAQGVRLVDPNLDNCLPSLHAALSTMAMLIVLFRTDLKIYKVFVAVSTIAIQFTILYLGIHWITDMLAGFLLAFTTFMIATRYSKTIQLIKKVLTNHSKNRNY